MVLIQDDLGVARHFPIPLPEITDIIGTGTPEAVDTLVVVAHYGNAVVLFRQASHDHIQGVVVILELVHDNGAVPFL